VPVVVATLGEPQVVMQPSPQPGMGEIRRGLPSSLSPVSPRRHKRRRLDDEDVGEEEEEEER